jgi:hypothetical protein
VEQVAGFRVCEQVPPAADRRGRLAGEPGVDQAGAGDPAGVAGEPGDGAGPRLVLAMDAFRAGGERACPPGCKLRRRTAAW